MHLPCAGISILKERYCYNWEGSVYYTEICSGLRWCSCDASYAASFSCLRSSAWRTRFVNCLRSVIHSLEDRYILIRDDWLVFVHCSRCSWWACVLEYHQREVLLHLQAEEVERDVSPTENAMELYLGTKGEKYIIWANNFIWWPHLLSLMQSTTYPCRTLQQCTQTIQYAAQALLQFDALTLWIKWLEGRAQRKRTHNAIGHT